MQPTKETYMYFIANNVILTITGHAKTRHISKNYTCSEKVRFLSPLMINKLYIAPYEIINEPLKFYRDSISRYV